MTATPENHLQVLEEVCAPAIADQAEKVDRGVVFPDQAYHNSERRRPVEDVSSTGVGGLRLAQSVHRCHEALRQTAGLNQEVHDAVELIAAGS